MIDTRCLGSGEDYNLLRKAYVIMITSFDPFDRNRMMYTVKNSCVEEADLPYDDGAYTIYLYVDGEPNGLPDELVHLLHYMKETTRSNATGNRLSDIQSMVEVVKQDREVQKKEMKFRELLRYERDEGREEERQNTIKERARADEVEKRAVEAEKRADEAELKRKEMERKLAERSL